MRMNKRYFLPSSATLGFNTDISTNGAETIDTSIVYLPDDSFSKEITRSYNASSSYKDYRDMLLLRVWLDFPDSDRITCEQEFSSNLIEPKQDYILSLYRDCTENILNKIAKDRNAERTKESLEKYQERMDKLKIVKEFVAKCNKRAEYNMIKTGVLEGAHHNAMKSVLLEMEMMHEEPEEKEDGYETVQRANKGIGIKGWF